jgi:hypothetical protein
MSDDDAFQVVERDHDGEYCSKNFFKKWWVPAIEGGVREEFRAKLVGNTVTKTETLHRNLQFKRERRRR